ncbi:MAG TPA: MOSC and FAD-binding oxidoreductase domain-containing protein [Polyangiaceae bacterium]|nr:MOSC and FAD-binding oxidoreductase domain-containing protein [Polyangiaceae bacterium]
MNKLLSLNVGLPRDIEWQGKTVRTAIWKEPVNGRRRVRRLNVDGDGQGDLGGHGGEQRAVFVYQIESYRYWEEQLRRSDLVCGQFGENLTVEGLADDVVCIGDRYRVGSALLEVTQPRVTCYRVGIRLQEPRMASLLVAHGRPGFYLRVLEEGELGAGDPISKVAEGPERMTVAEASALLYKPGHLRRELERALRIPALSPGWRASFQALLDAEASGRALAGNPGLVSTGPMTAPGFRTLRVAQITRESTSITSFVFESVDAAPLPTALPGQFVVLRMQSTPGGPPLLRSYSLSGPEGEARYRISVKLEAHGAGSAYLHGHVQVGDLLEVSGPRGSFTLVPSERAVVLLSAGVGATPVLAMLHALANLPAPPPVWWVHGARNGSEHAFARESRELLRRLPGSRSFVVYSQPGATDRSGEDFDATGHIALPLIEKLGVPRDADLYLCGPAAFLHDLSAGLVASGFAPERVHTEIFGPGESMTPGVIGATKRAPHPPPGPPGPGPRISFARSGLTVRWDPACQSLLELAEACDVPVKWSCRTGVCHSCETGLISGSVSYSLEPLEPPAGGNVLTCCSIPSDDLDLDL